VTTDPAGAAASPATAAVRHAVAVYDSDDALRDLVLPFVHEGLDGAERVVVLVSPPAEAGLRVALGAEASRVRWSLPGAPLDHHGRRSEAVRAHLEAQRRAHGRTRLLVEHGVGGGRARLEDALRRDAADNELLGRYGFPWTCLYDARTTDADLLDAVVAAHPAQLGASGVARANPSYLPPSRFLASRPATVAEVPERPPVDVPLSGVEAVTAARRVVGRLAERLGVPEQGRDEVELAVAEVAVNAVTHGRPPARVRAWAEGGSLVVRVDDAGDGGAIALAGWRPPGATAGGAGLWVARQLADVVAAGRTEAGTAVEVRFPVPHDHRIAGAGAADVVADAYDRSPAVQMAYEGRELRVVAANEAARRLLGHLDPLGRPMREVFEGLGDAVQMPAMLEEVQRTGRPLSVMEWRMQVPDADGAVQDRYFNVHATPWHFRDGRVRGVLATAIPVTELVLARRAAQARSDELAAQYEQAHTLVGALQRALLPADLPVLPGLRVAARYLLADGDGAAGGDWFDAVRLGDDRVGLAVGDVVGHGVAASAVMGQLRAVARERLRAGVGVEEVVAALDRFAADVPAARGATVCVAVLEPESGSLSYCTAGHPPPLVVGPDGAARYLPPTGTPPLAAGEAGAAGPEVAEVALAPQEILLLYTDGLLERPGRTPAQSTVELAQVAGDLVAGRLFPADPGDATERLCEAVLELLTRATGHTDDISVLAVQLVAAPSVMQLRLPATTPSIRLQRIALGAWLSEVGAGDDDHFSIQHAVSELVTNAVEHAYDNPSHPSAQVRVDAALTADGEVLVTVADQGRWRTVGGGAGGGRGLAVAAELVDALELERGDTGTVAVVRRRLRRPARLAPAPARPPVAAAGSFSLRTGGDPDELVVAGPLDAENAEALRLELMRLSQAGSRSVTVDLSDVSHLDSVAVRVLHDVARRHEAHHEQLRLVAPPGSTAHQILALVDLAHLVDDPE
jgi:anti-anti-sigma factor